MEAILTRCGYRCDLCLAYRPNVEANPENQVVLSDGWFAYFGFRVPPEQILCDGCLSAAPRLIDSACPVRPCAIENGVATCAACPDYGCERLAERLVTFEEVQQRIGRPIPPADRERFIRPYESKARLEALRRSGR